MNEKNYKYNEKKIRFVQTSKVRPNSKESKISIFLLNNLKLFETF